MDLERLAFAYEIAKIAQAKTEKNNYGKAILVAAPAAVAQAASDYPKGYIDKKVETLVGSGLKSAIKAKAWKTGAGRALGRLGAGPVTAPLFFSGIKDLKEGKKREGYAKVLAASGGYSAAKGGIEGLYANRGRGLKGKQIKAIAKSVAGTRGILGLAAGAVTANSIANAQKKSKKSKSLKSRIAVPAAIGAAIGLPKGMLEHLATPGVKKTLRSTLAKGVGRSAAGVIGAVAISEAARALTKKASAQSGEFSMAPSAGQIYAQTRTAAKSKSDQQLQNFLKARHNPERTPTKRAKTYAVNDELRSRGVAVPAEKMREKTHLPMVKGTSLAHTAAVAALIASPSLVWGLGISQLPGSEKDSVLREAMDQLAEAEGIHRIQAGSKSTKYGDLIDFDAPAEAFYQNVGSGGADARRNYGRAVLEHHQNASPGAKTRAAAFAQGVDSGKIQKIISAPAKAHSSTIAHEVGHATAGALRKKTLQSPISRMMYNVSRIPAIAIPLIVLDSASDNSFHTKEEIEAKAKFIERVGMVTALLGAPEMAEEATASIKGLKYLQRAGATRKQIGKAALRLLPAFGTYSAPFATAAIAARVLRSRPEVEARDRKPSSG